MINPYALLNPVSGIQSIVGTGSSPQQSRIYPGVAPESAAMPYVEYHLTTETPFSTIAGVSDAMRQSFQFSCYATTYDGANTLANAVFAALEGNGYQDYRSGPMYDEKTKTFLVPLDWSFIDV